eukprot:592388-Hanusia_phi.AAC.3
MSFGRETERGMLRVYGREGRGGRGTKKETGCLPRRTPGGTKWEHGARTGVRVGGAGFKVRSKPAVEIGRGVRGKEGAGCTFGGKCSSFSSKP